MRKLNQSIRKAVWNSIVYDPLQEIEYETLLFFSNMRGFNLKMLQKLIMDGDPIELLGMLFFTIYIIVKPIICYHYIKLNNDIIKKGILGEATLLEVKRISLQRIPPDYNYIIQFYLNDKRIKGNTAQRSSPKKW